MVKRPTSCLKTVFKIASILKRQDLKRKQEIMGKIPQLLEGRIGFKRPDPVTVAERKIYKTMINYMNILSQICKLIFWIVEWFETIVQNKLIMKVSVCEAGYDP